MFCLSTCLLPFCLTFQGIVKLGFFERKLQVLEAEKFEEWLGNRPAERLLEIGVEKITIKKIIVLLLNEIKHLKMKCEFQWTAFYVHLLKG